MIRGFVILFILAGIFLIGAWTQQLRVQNLELEQKNKDLAKKLSAERAYSAKLYDQLVAQAGTVNNTVKASNATIQDLQNQLTNELNKLHGLEKQRDEIQVTLKQHPETPADSHIREDKALITKLNDQLKQMTEDDRAVTANSSAYRTQQVQNLKRQQIDVEGQIQQVNLALRDTQNQLQGLNQDHTNPTRKTDIQNAKNQIAVLHSQKTTLETQHRQIVQQTHSLDQAVNAEVQTEKNEVAGDRRKLQEDLNHAKADLDHWQQGQKTDSQQITGLRDRAKKIDQDIGAEKDKIQILQKTISTMK